MRRDVVIAVALGVCGCAARGQAAAATAVADTNTVSKFRSAEDGWLDVSGFLDEPYGFLPVAMPITEPAVGYGAAGGLAFISKPPGAAREGFNRPNITVAGGMATENGTWGAVVGDMRHWLDDRLQTRAGVVHASVNLDFHGIGADARLEDNPLQYNLEPAGGMLEGRYRLGDSHFWGGLGYAFARTQVTFDAPAGTAGLPDFRSESTVGGLTPSFMFDSRDNIFTPAHGTYVELSAGVFSEAFGGDDEFQRVRLIAMQFLAFGPRLHLGLRGEAAASFGDAPFYLRPFIYMRGAPIMRYQGQETTQIEAEVRWQFWKRLSLVGFTGGGAAWNDFEHLENTQTVMTGGAGFRYELARKYGIHAGLDVAFGPDGAAFYVQVGSAWARP